MELDFSGDLYWKQRSNIELVVNSHDHGINPKSIPTKRPLTISDGVWIAQRSIVLSQVERIGENSIIGAGSIVTMNVPDNVIVAGIPARVIKHLHETSDSSA